MKSRCRPLALALLSATLALPCALRADVIKMKDGKVYPNSKVLSETPDTVTFDYVVVGTIHDTRTEPKAAIAEIVKQRPEETEILALRKLLPTADLLTADKYESLIQDQVRPFVTKYAGTPQAAEAEEIIKTLQAEKEKVVGGSLKVEGEWVSADMVKRDAHSIDAFRVRRDMKEIAADGKGPPEVRYKDALTEWQKMSDPDGGYTDTLQYVKAIPEVLAILESYKKILDRMILDEPGLEKRRKDNLDKMLPSDPLRVRTKNAIDAETAAFKNESDLEKKSRVHWYSVSKYDIKSLQAADKAVIDEMAKLKILDLNKLTTQNEALVAATRYLADGNVEQTEASLQRASAVTGLKGASSTKAIQNLRTQLAALKKIQTEKLRAKSIYGNGKINAVTNGTGAAVDSRVADAVAATDKANSDKKGSKDAEKGDTTAEGPDGAAPASTKGEDTKSSKRKDKEKTKKHAVPSIPKTVATTPEPVEEGGMQKYLFLGGGGLLAVLITVMFLQKRKQKA